jgi:hypothetical protein
MWEATRGSYMVLYALLKNAFDPAARGGQSNAGSGPPLPLWARLLAGGGANVLNIAAWYPLNTVLHVQQSELPPGLMQPSAPTQPRVARGLLETGRTLHASGGWVRLYRGFGYTMLRAGPVAAVVMPSFEIVLPWLERQMWRL